VPLRRFRLSVPDQQIPALIASRTCSLPFPPLKAAVPDSRSNSTLDKMNHFVDTDPCRCHRSSETSLSPEGILAIRMITKPCTVGDRSWKCGGINRKSCVGRSANTGRLSKSNPSRRCLRRKEEMEWPVCAALSDPDDSAL